MKKILTCLLCCVLILGLCGCKKEKETSKNETNKEEIKKEETTNAQETISKEEENIEKPKEEHIMPPKEEINKKIVVCTLDEEGSYYSSIITQTTTFENDVIIHDKLYIEKKFKEGYLAEEDDWTITNINALQNNTKAGISGNAYIENNITYLTINYDVKANSKLIELITTHTEYNDFFNHMTTNNGYSCVNK